MPETTRVAHLSDLHFGRHVDAVTEALLAELRAGRPDVIVISGDFTQRARRREFEVAAEFLNRLPAPVVAVPGNHDVEAWNLSRRMSAPLHRYKRHITAELQPQWQDERVSILGVNTTRRAGFYLDWSRGALSRRRLASIRAHFERVDSGKLKILATHHPFAQKSTPRPRRLIDTPRNCLSALAECGVELVLSGHFHHGHVALLRAPADGVRALLAVQAGTATSNRLKGEPNSFNWIAVHPLESPRYTIQRYDWRDDGEWSAAGVPITDSSRSGTSGWTDSVRPGQGDQ